MCFITKTQSETYWCEQVGTGSSFEAPLILGDQALDLRQFAPDDLSGTLRARASRLHDAHAGKRSKGR